MKNNTIFLKMIWLIFILILIDQTIKIIVLNGQYEEISEQWISIMPVHNTGIAFGLNSGNTKNILLTVIVMMVVGNYIINQKEKIDIKTGLALSLIIGGGLSNLIDRIFRGGVVDFIYVRYFSVFNVADCYIVFGWIIMVISIIKTNQELLGGKKCEKK